MICDEVQTGMGRTGKWFAFQHSRVLPDIINLAKGVASGVPIGAIIARDCLEFTKGGHGSTFAGGPIACAAGNATFDVLKSVVPRVVSKGERFRKGLEKLHSRVRGLMIGFTACEKAPAIAEYCKEHAVLINVAGDENIRIVPPLIIESREIDRAVGVINEAAESV
jgi:acetylornithine/N-succinyldiaminopimelate aminotransferase